MIKNCGWIVHHLVPIVPEAPTPVNIFKVEKKSFVHEAHVFQGAGTHEHSRAEHPVGGLDFVWISISHHKVIGEIFEIAKIFQERAASKNRQRSIEAMVRALVLAIEVQKLGRQDADVFMLVHVRQHLLHCAFGHERIRIENEPVGAGGLSQANIHALGKADVIFGVVHHLDFVVYPLQMLFQALQTESQQLRRAIMDDDD